VLFDGVRVGPKIRDGVSVFAAQLGVLVDESAKKVDHLTRVERHRSIMTREWSPRRPMPRQVQS
jgi:hypothetical protein